MCIRGKIGPIIFLIIKEPFKATLSKIYGKTECYNPYLQGISNGHVHLSRMRMKLSGLNAHRNRHHFIDFKSCPNCMAVTEDEIHFFLSCTDYAALRQDLLTQLRRMFPQYVNLIDHPETRRNQKLLLKE